MPVSVTATDVIVPFDVALMVTVPPGTLYLIALDRMLSSTWWKRWRSQLAHGAVAPAGSTRSDTRAVWAVGSTNRNASSIASATFTGSIENVT